MKLNTLATALVLTLSFVQIAHAEFIPGWERPIKRAEMKIIPNKFRVIKLNEMTLTLTRQDGSEDSSPTGMVVEMRNTRTNEKTVQRLAINSVKIDQCGTALYEAHAATYSTPYSNDVGQRADDGASSIRLSVRLTDHTQRIASVDCGDAFPHPNDSEWQAQIATSDSSFTAVGTPTDVFTIAGALPSE